MSEIEIAAASIFPAGWIPEQMLTESTAPELLEEGARSGRLWVALAGNALPGKAFSPVGYALMREIEKLALLAQIDVHPEHSGRGIGRALIRQVAQRATRDGHAALFLTIFAGIAWNAPFYERLGFEVLRPTETPATILEILKHERRAGLKNRVAMRLSISS